MNKALSKLVVLAVMTACSLGAYAQQKAVKKPGRPPNIIYIFADDLGYGELGSYGQQKIKTPNLDQLARQGMRFTQHYTSTPVCAPARCMLLTGRHGGHAYIRSNYALNKDYDIGEWGQMPLPEGTFTIGHMLQQAGYVTGAIGKWGLGSMQTTGEPEKQGFDYFYGYLGQAQAHSYYPSHLRENNTWVKLQNDFVLPHAQLEKGATSDQFEKFSGKDYAPDKMTEKALGFIDKHQQKPFFLYLPYTIPHVALQIPKDSKAFALYQGKWDTIPYYGQQGYTPTLQPLATYAAMITQLDAYVGQIMKKIKDAGQDGQTLIMFSSDNGTTFNGGVQAGFFNSVAGLRGLKMDLYEGGIRIPFLARWPGHIPAGTVTDHVSVQYDLMATLADLLKIKIPPNDGLSMLPTLLGKPGEQKKHGYLYFEYPEKGGQLAIRMGDLKAVKVNVRKDPHGPWEIYDLAKDPAETQNIARLHAGLSKKLDEIVRKEHQLTHVREWEIVGRDFSTHPQNH